MQDLTPEAAVQPPAEVAGEQGACDLQVLLEQSQDDQLEVRHAATYCISN